MASLNTDRKSAQSSDTMISVGTRCESESTAVTVKDHEEEIPFHLMSTKSAG